jgi:hypothetical protein
MIPGLCGGWRGWVSEGVHYHEDDSQSVARMYRNYGIGWVGCSGERCRCPASPRTSQTPQVDRKS